MPIYEFYCVACHRVFNFFARTPNTNKIPACPRCERHPLERQVSRFAISRGRSEAASDDQELPPGMDEAEMERALSAIASEAEGGNEEDPRHIARMMRKLYEGTGLNLGGSMEEALRRMEAGEDPDKIEEEMGDLLEVEDPLAGGSGGSLGRLSRKLRPPQVDEELYEL